MSIVDESHLSQRAEETTFYHSENITFSRNFLENLIQASDDLLNRCLNEEAQFLAELAATLSENYHHNGQEERLPKIPTSVRERPRIIQARTNIYNFQCSQVQLCLKETFCSSEEADYLRFLAEYRQIARSLPENWTEQTASEVGLISKQPGFGALRLKLEEKVMSGNADAFTIYLLGLAYKAVGDLDKAKQTFIQSIKIYSYLWPAWRGLLTCFTGSLESVQQELASLSVNSDLKVFFLLEYSIQHDEHLSTAINAINTLIDIFPNNIDIHGLLGRAYANNRDTELSISALESIRNITDDSSVKYMDVLSNQYFMSQSRAQLAALVHALWATEKYSFETCIATANYYSLRGQKSTAIEYFERAMVLNPSYYDAWTLIGHEYIELRNFSQGLHSYRKAIAGNPNDYKAWYGLGQAYEMLKNHTSALTHHLKALNLRPNNDRICEAIGDSYEKLDQLDIAKRYFKRASRLSQFSSASCLSKIARICRRMKDDDKAAKYYEMYVQAEVEEDHLDQRHEGYSEAYFFLAQYYIEQKKDFSSGAPFARKCVWYIPTRDEGAKLLKKLPKKELFAGTCVNVSAEGDISRRPLSETLPSQDTSREKHEQLMSDSPKCKEKQQIDKFDNWSDFVKTTFE